MDKKILAKGVICFQGVKDDGCVHVILLATKESNISVATDLYQISREIW